MPNSVNFVVDIQNGQVVVNTSGPDPKSILKAAGGNAKVKKNTKLFWQAASDVGFDLGFATLEDAHDDEWPKLTFPFSNESSDGDVDAALYPQVRNCTYFEAKAKAVTQDPDLILVKYTITAWKNGVEAELDPMIIIEK